MLHKGQGTTCLPPTASGIPQAVHAFSTSSKVLVPLQLILGLNSSTPFKGGSSTQEIPDSNNNFDYIFIVLKFSDVYINTTAASSQQYCTGNNAKIKPLSTFIMPVSLSAI